MSKNGNKSKENAPQRRATDVCHTDVTLTDLPPLEMDTCSIREDFRRYYNHTLGRDEFCNYQHFKYDALALTLRSRLLERWKETRFNHKDNKPKRTFYLSLEFLMGRTLGNAMLNLGVTKEVIEGLRQVEIELDEVGELEVDAGLGNGGLGRLAACFMDSCATLKLPVTGFGLRYEYGMFRQKIVNGEQVEEPDHWLRDGNPWELERPEFTKRVKFGGRTEIYKNEKGESRVSWVDTQDVLAIPYDVPIPGYKNDYVNTLRLWSASATDMFDLGEFNAGSYPESVEAKNAAENITMVLYPNDASENGKVLRLKQQYFLASASMQDVFRYWFEVRKETNFSQFAESHCFQLNDTHPTLAVAELMRLLVDEHYVPWDDAWKICTSTMAYTNHTLLPEALEKWPVRLFAELLPRLLEIIYEINARFISEVARHWPGDHERQRRMSIIEDGPEQFVRMANLAIIGSFSVNGVAALHTRLLSEGLFADFYALWPKKFSNKTNGVTPRRWLALANPYLSELITQKIGENWITQLDELKKLENFIDDTAFCADWAEAKLLAKKRLARMVENCCQVKIKTNMLFDVQVKRIHEYKRQLLNVLHVIHLYDRLKKGNTEGFTPRCIFIGGKAAPGYVMAKKIIKLINNVAEIINKDESLDDLLKLVFVPNYSVTTMEIIAPGTDLSEQVSTAGKEASGTGNMKFMMNGAITIGTYDGANIEIMEEVGKDNFFLFGLKAEEVEELKHHYDPIAYIEGDEDLKRVMKLLESGHFNLFEPNIFDDIINSIKNPYDPWMTAADFRSFVYAQDQVAEAYKDKKNWVRMSILNTARSGKFSTDRTMLEYNKDIWKMQQGDNA